MCGRASKQSGAPIIERRQIPMCLGVISFYGQVVILGAFGLTLLIPGSCYRSLTTSGKMLRVLSRVFPYFFLTQWGIGIGVLTAQLFIQRRGSVLRAASMLSPDASNQIYLANAYKLVLNYLGYDIFGRAIQA